MIIIFILYQLYLYIQDSIFGGIFVIVIWYSVNVDNNNNNINNIFYAFRHFGKSLRQCIVHCPYLM